MKKTIFTGAGVAVATPMHADGAIDWESFGRLIDWQITNGADSIIVCGTTGESSTMSDEEHVASIKFVQNHVKGRVPVIAGAGSNETSYAIRLAKESKALGVDGILVVTPYYNKTSQRGLIAHYNAIADATDLPIILYSVQGRTGLNITPATCKELSKHPNIVAVKEASGNISQVAAIRHLCGDDLDIYSGNDDMIVPTLSLGGKGVISVLANICPKETHDMCQYFFDGKIKEAEKLQVDYLDLINALFIDVNPIPVKEAIAAMGYGTRFCRMPLYEMTEADKKVLLDAMKAHKVI